MLDWLDVTFVSEATSESDCVEALHRDYYYYYYNFYYYQTNKQLLRRVVIKMQR